jgi:hypothetical protein
LPKGLNVGLCWQSGGHLNTARAAQQMKSIPTSLLSAFKLPGVNLISLQKPEMPDVPPALGLVDWMDQCESFSDTACLIAALDLVLTVDTAVAHLAGAMGKDVWNFVRFSGYWPWLGEKWAINGNHSIWYPSMVLYRQPQLNNWADLIKRARQDLENRVRETQR